MNLEGTIRRSPKEFRGIDAGIVAEGFLKALGDGYFEEAAHIARLLKQRPPENYSIIQDRKFTARVGMGMPDYVSNMVTAKAAITALQELGYEITPKRTFAIMALVEAKERPLGARGHAFSCHPQERTDGLAVGTLVALQAQRARMQRAGRVSGDPSRKVGPPLSAS